MKRFKKLPLLLTLAALFAVLPACATQAPGQTAGQAPAAAQATAAAPEEGAAYGAVGAFTTKDTAGNQVTEAAFAEADVTMLNVWATFCGYCIREMPELSALNEEFAQQGFQILGLVGDVGDMRGGFTEDDMAAAQAVMDKAGAKFPTLMPSAELIASLLTRVPGYPTTFFVDSEGNLLGEPVVGAKGEEFWRGAIEAYLKAAPEREAMG